MRQRQRRSKHLSIISYPPGPGQRVTSDINIYILEYVRAGGIGRAVNMELDAGKKTEDGREEVRQDGKNAGDAPDLIWTLSEKTRIAANENLDEHRP